MPDELPHDWLAFEPDRALSVVVGFLAEQVDQTGAEGVVVGLSGGIDSATTLAAAVEALGPDAVDAIALPGPTSSKRDHELAEQVAGAFGVDLGQADIGPAVEALEPELGVDPDRDTRANLQARLRMCVLYARANATGSLVLGTGNKSELLTGYFTKHGDGAADLLPLGDLYKTQLRQVAKRLGVPEPVLEREPTAGLWEGQTDADELGLTYDVLDVVLAGIENQFGDEKIAEAADVSPDEVSRVRAMVRGSEHKRSTPPAPKLGWRTPGVDWREPTN